MESCLAPPFAERLVTSKTQPERAMLQKIHFVSGGHASTLNRSGPIHLRMTEQECCDLTDGPNSAGSVAQNHLAQLEPSHGSRSVNRPSVRPCDLPVRTVPL